MATYPWTRPGSQCVKEGNIAVADRGTSIGFIVDDALHVTESHVRGVLPFVQERVVVRSEQTQALAAFHEVLYGGAGNCSPVECAGSPSEFVCKQKHGVVCEIWPRPSETASNEFGCFKADSPMITKLLLVAPRRAAAVSAS